jgi:Na+-driven multidrug efflux pump
LHVEHPLELAPEALHRNITRLAVPVVLENVLGTMVFFADGLLVGWMRDPVALAAQFVLAASLVGAGDTRSPLYVSIVGVTLFRVPVVYLLAITLGWGLAGVWFDTVLDWTARAATSFVLYRRGAWKRVVL